MWARNCYTDADSGCMLVGVHYTNKHSLRSVQQTRHWTCCVTPALVCPGGGGAPYHPVIFCMNTINPVPFPAENNPSPNLPPPPARFSSLAFYVCNFDYSCCSAHLNSYKNSLQSAWHPEYIKARFYATVGFVTWSAFSQFIWNKMTVLIKFTIVSCVLFD